MLIVFAALLTLAETPPSTATATITTATAAPTRVELLAFSGNEVLNDQVYRAILDLPKGARPTAALALEVKRRLLEFLHRAGYELATVEVAVAAEHLEVTIDEGHVDKVIFLGEGAFQTLRLKLELSLPHAVFNRAELEKQLSELAARHQLIAVRWRLVPVEEVEHVGPQLEGLGSIQDIPILPRQHPYELHILLGHADWDVGLSPDLRIDSLEGFGLGVHWRDRSLLLENDRFEVRGRGAVNMRTTIDEGSNEIVLSRALAESRWYTPPIVGQSLRSFAWLRADLLNRQRGDLGLEAFFYFPLEASANLELQPMHELAISLGLGLQHRRLFALHRATTVPVSAFVDRTPGDETRTFGVLGVDLLFNTDEIRLDRKHQLTLELRMFAPADESRGGALRLAYGYQKTFMFGWHELRVRSRGVWLDGDVMFPDEEAIGGSHLRGPFSGQYYARKLASAGAELRFSVSRDLFKVGVFHDLATFRKIDRVTDDSSLAVADAFGIGIHALFLDAFALDAYFGLGFASGGVFGSGFQLEIDQAF